MLTSTLHYLSGLLPPLHSALGLEHPLRIFPSLLGSGVYFSPPTLQAYCFGLPLYSLHLLPVSLANKLTALQLETLQATSHNNLIV